MIFSKRLLFGSTGSWSWHFNVKWALMHIEFRLPLFLCSISSPLRQGFVLRTAALPTFSLCNPHSVSTHEYRWMLPTPLGPDIITQSWGRFTYAVHCCRQQRHTVHAWACCFPQSAAFFWEDGIMALFPWSYSFAYQSVAEGPGPFT